MTWESSYSRTRDYDNRATPEDRGGGAGSRSRWLIFVPGFPRSATVKLTFKLEVKDDETGEFDEIEETAEWELPSDPDDVVEYNEAIAEAFDDNEYVSNYLYFSDGDLNFFEAECYSKSKSKVRILRVRGKLVDVQGGMGACVQVRYCSG